MIKLIEINESWAVDTDGDKNVILMKKVEKLTSPYEKDRGFVLNLIIELLTDYI